MSWINLFSRMTRPLLILLVAISAHAALIPGSDQSEIHRSKFSRFHRFHRYGKNTGIRAFEYSGEKLSDRIAHQSVHRNRVL